MRLPSMPAHVRMVNRGRKLLEQWERFKKRTGDPITAAILTLAVSLASDKGKRTGLTIQEAGDVPRGPRVDCQATL